MRTGEEEEAVKTALHELTDYYCYCCDWKGIHTAEKWESCIASFLPYSQNDLGFMISYNVDQVVLPSSAVCEYQSCTAFHIPAIVRMSSVEYNSATSKDICLALWWFIFVLIRIMVTRSAPSRISPCHWTSFRWQASFFDISDLQGLSKNCKDRELKYESLSVLSVERGSSNLSIRR